MKKLFRNAVLGLALLSTSQLAVSQNWEMKPVPLATEWASQVDPNNVLPEYPRPIMERTDWMNLNGLWNYSILPAGAATPQSFEGKILVPFPVESALSGVQRKVGRDNELWYERSFKVPSKWKGKNILLHFGAVDWKADIYLNNIKVGSHKGGYTPFTFDITPFLGSGDQKLTVKVWDPTSDGYQPRGKQVTNPEGIWYTSVTGIWQTVWLEPVNKKHITAVNTVADIDRNYLTVDVLSENAQATDLVQVVLKDGGKTVATAKGVAGLSLELPVPNAKLWTPDSPFLYDLEVSLLDNGKAVDAVKSYTAMRKVSIHKDHEGIVRLQLNNQDCFHFGPLDQGWWPDGLYTAPTDEALVFDIIKTKEWGYNMIRKHVKVEPARWYTHCDRLGILVWQDMPNGGDSPRWELYNYFEGVEVVRSIESEDNFKREWKDIIDYLKPYPSIAVWVPFNECWGQFKTKEIVEWTKNYDPSRLVNPASGGNHYKTGDILDYHKYPAPEMMMYDPERATVIGEYGGVGLPVEGHLWQNDRNWGYTQFKNPKEVTDEYIKYTDALLKLVKRGISAAVYTQTTDVEGEINGIVTYDRKIMKLEEDRLKKANQEICNSLNNK